MRTIIHILFVGCLCLVALTGTAQVTFCGEMVPMERDFVSYKLMDVIKGHLKYRNFLPVLKAKTDIYFPVIIPILHQYNIPEDFKYLPVVESGFTNATSAVGAQGVWQFMPATAAAMGLEVRYDNDERNHLLKSTHAACRYLQQLYGQLHSWTLAAAAYNAGAGNISRNIKRQGSSDYYQLVLNNETAQYIYKIIAIKQLFESPELYIPGFGYNVFNKENANVSVFSKPSSGIVQPGQTNKDFKSIRITVDVKSRGRNPVVAAVFAARLQQNNTFEDGQLVSILLLDDLQANGVYIRKNTKLSGRGWIVSDRVYVDLGFGNTITLCDAGGRKGVPAGSLKSGEDVRLMKM
ncbi:transglycosylase SLT domain-containing protein [Chitinophaga filiformis]|uniref:transglycosylase SLT domain-containing protein n=1 Tax=Chitinophaga filiformis TaxID=104663 RepID=UPI001F38E98D|nr:transglycosylase SLT domain-containing protein [Chitinophaga filiformis]MCF6402712.1 transglycosylase SLT domain-containing protein [Chitinophaga filiformis]MCF6403370.1 transglycosylase SLT domain-containing protein [Chitinophaga filiformis]